MIRFVVLHRQIMIVSDEEIPADLFGGLFLSRWADALLPTSKGEGWRYSYQPELHAEVLRRVRRRYPAEAVHLSPVIDVLHAEYGQLHVVDTQVPGTTQPLSAAFLFTQLGRLGIRWDAPLNVAQAAYVAQVARSIAEGLNQEATYEEAYKLWRRLRVDLDPPNTIVTLRQEVSILSAEAEKLAATAWRGPA